MNDLASPHSFAPFTWLQEALFKDWDSVYAVNNSLSVLYSKRTVVVNLAMIKSVLVKLNEIYFDFLKLIAWPEGNMCEIWICFVIVYLLKGSIPYHSTFAAKFVHFLTEFLQLLLFTGLSSCMQVITP